ncbi:MAG TPA: hypothetical protein VNO52_03775 [Methylomirabilota bacterium]|nr:hypothetical protein [Methylomirabilota bacterium]
MKAALQFIVAAALLPLFGACHREHDHAHDDHDHAHGGGHGHSHGDDAESFSGATFAEGKGVTLLEETRRSLGLQTVEVGEQRLPREIRFVVRLFEVATNDDSTPGPLALGTMRTNDAATLHAGLPVALKTPAGVTVTGQVQRVWQPLPHDEAEIVVALHSSPSLRNGDFAEATVTVPGERTALVIPREAVIRGAMGDLVYVVNGDVYLLTWVELGAESAGLIEVTDGLLAGDSVVTRGALDLWLVELRALKGGQGCCPTPPKKEKR